MATIEERVSRLEGVLEQMNERLGNLERGQEALRAEVRGNFRWTIGLILGMWASVIAAVLGALLTR